MGRHAYEVSEDSEQVAWSKASEALFRSPLKEFVAQRKALVSQLMRSGQRELAGRVRTLGKPSLVAWLVNQLYYDHRSAWDRALATGAALRRAQEQGGRGAADIQALIQAHRRELQRLQQLALELSEAADVKVQRGHERQLQDTLEAVAIGVVDPSLYGRLTHALTPGGFDALDATRVSHASPAVAGAPLHAAEVTPPTVSEGGQAEPRNEQPQEHLRQALLRAQAQEVSCVREWDAARVEQDQARQLVDQVEAQRVLEVQHRQQAYEVLTQAQAALSAVQQRLEAVEAQAKQAREVAREAAERVAAAERALATAEAARRNAELAATANG